MVDLGESLDLHVAAGGLPFVVLLEQHRADQAGDGRLVREDPHDFGPAFHFLVQAFYGVCAVQFCAVLSGQYHVGQHVVLALVHEIRQLGPAAAADLVGNTVLGFSSGYAVGLIEGLPDRGGNHGVLAA